MRGDSANPCSHPDPRRSSFARVGSRRRVLDPDWLTRRVRRMTGIAPERTSRRAARRANSTGRNRRNPFTLIPEIMKTVSATKKMTATYPPPSKPYLAVQKLMCVSYPC